MIKIQVTSDDYLWTHTFPDDGEARAFLASDSVWVTETDAEVLEARFRYDGEAITNEYRIAKGVPGKLYIIMVWRYVKRRGQDHENLDQVICRVVAETRKVRKRARRS